MLKAQVKAEEINDNTPKPKTRQPPKGVTVVKEKKEKPKQKYAIHKFDSPVLADTPRNVYRETVTDEDAKTEEWIWYHCEDGSYVGIEPIYEKRKDRLKPYHTGDKFIIPYTVDNAKKIKELCSPRTKFYKKHQATRITITKEEF